MKFYVNWRYDGYLESVDQFETEEEAWEMLPQVRRNSNIGMLYVSRRASADRDATYTAAGRV